jgi:peptidoglycan/LPS O-acetylase OafA/YrhL
MIEPREIKSTRNTFLDVVRGVAIIGVVSVHSMGLAEAIIERSGGSIHPLVGDLLGYGSYGVELFFALSGYLLASIYGFDKKVQISKYFVRRIARIYPLWIIFLIVQIFRFYLGYDGGWADAQKFNQDQVSYLHHPLVIFFLSVTFMLWVSASLWNTVIPGGWSIQAEIGHYILFPLIGKYGIRNVIKYSCFIKLISLLILQLVSNTTFFELPSFITLVANAWLRLNLFATFDFFILGVITYLVYSDKEVRSYRKILDKLQISPTIFLLFTLTFFMVPLYSGRMIEALGFVVISVLVSVQIHKIVFIRRITIILGKYSYFIYFCHFNILFVVYKISTNFNLILVNIYSIYLFCIVLFLVVLVSSLAIAIPSFRYIEKPIISKAH